MQRIPNEPLRTPLNLKPKKVGVGIKPNPEFKDGRSRSKLAPEVVKRRLEIMQEGYRKGMSTKEIAQTLGISVPYVHILKTKIIKGNSEIIRERLESIKRLPRTKNRIMEISAIERQLALLGGEKVGPVLTKKAKNIKEQKANLQRIGMIAGIKQVNGREVIVPTKTSFLLAEKRLQQITKDLNALMNKFGIYGLSSKEIDIDSEQKRRLIDERDQLVSFVRGNATGPRIIEILENLAEQNKK